MKTKAAFFDPTRHLKDYKLSEQRRPTTLEESNALYVTLVKRAMTFLTGVNKNEFREKDKYDMLNFDPFFTLAIDFIDYFKKANPNKEDETIKGYLKGTYNSSLGFFHYFNVFVPMVLAVEYAAVCMKEKALENYTYENDWERNTPLLACAYTLFCVLGTHLLILSVVLHAWLALIQSLVAITLVTLSSAIWYPIALAVTESPVDYDIKHYDSAEDEDCLLSTSDTYKSTLSQT